MQQSSATPKNQNVGIGSRKIVAYSHSSSQCHHVSTVFGTVSSLHPTSFLYLFNYQGLALTVYSAYAYSVILLSTRAVRSTRELVVTFTCNQDNFLFLLLFFYYFFTIILCVYTMTIVD